jgi:hypothetical protein
MERIRMFRLGWRRRSMLILDAAGTPRWLSRWLCRPTRKERRAWSELSRRASEHPGVDEEMRRRIMDEED